MTTNGILGKDTKDWQRLARSGIAGGIAGCVAKTVVAPLDRVKILFQTSNPDFRKYAGSWAGMVQAIRIIYQQNGVRGLLQGHSATLLRIFPYAGIKFMTYDQMHQYLMPTVADETNGRRFVAGATSGVVSVLFTYPLELVRVRLAFETRAMQESGVQRVKPSLSHAIFQIYSEGSMTPTAGSKSKASSHIFGAFPLLRFYRGFTPTIIGMVPYAGTSFLVWGYLRSYFLPPSPTSGKSKSKLHPVTDLILGGIAGALAQTTSYPFEVVRRRMQIGGVTRPDSWLGWGETAKSIWKQKGWRGFYVGLGIGFIKVIPMTAVSYSVWEMGKAIMHI